MGQAADLISWLTIYTVYYLYIHNIAFANSKFQTIKKEKEIPTP